MTNLLIYGENTAALRYLIEKKKLKGKIDLIYIDPPFSTGIKFTISKTRASTISSVKNADVAYNDNLKGEEFLDFLRQRLVLLKELLSEQGSIYLHIDYKIGHYVKILMDEVFGFDNFRNDITRIKCNPKNFKRKAFGNIKDMVLFYSKGKEVIWNEPYEPYTQKDIEKLFKKQTVDGRHYTTVPLHAPGETQNGETGECFKGLYPPEGRHWRADIKTLNEWDKKGLIEWSKTGNPRKIIFADERKGKRMQDIWIYKDPQKANYPTEKNFNLLDLIIKTSSNKNSIVLDCFGGSGTTSLAAAYNQRNWISIDESVHAINATKKKIEGSISQSCYEYLEI